MRTAAVNRRVGASQQGRSVPNLCGEQSRMSIHSCVRFLAAALVALGVASAQAQSGASRLATYTKDGQSYFALSLLPTLKADPAQKNDVVILVDTSASQAGQYRDGALAALNSLLANLKPEDRVQLMAVDAKAVPMSAGFVAPGSPAMQAGLAKLQGR